jgi:hypothetical protein
MNFQSISTRCGAPAALLALSALLAACGGGGVADTPAAPAPGPAQVEGRAAVLEAGAALEPAPPALSGNVVCRNQVITGASLDSVSVPDDAACRLEASSLIGSITVGRGATLDAIAVDVDGNLQADGAAHVALIGGSVVGGSVQIKQGGSALVDGARIGADLQLDEMRGLVAATGNRLGGNLQAVGNRGGVSIEGNTMNGSLQCKENQPAPYAADNQAASIEDQCVPQIGGGGGSSGGSGGGTVPAGPVSGSVTCDGLRLGAVEVDELIVPDDAVCVLEGTRVGGSIKVGGNARLSATDVDVDGNLQADGAAQTLVGGASRFGGSVQIKQGGSASVTGAAINGDLQFDAMAAPLVASANAIGGNLQAVGNGGGVSLSANRIGGNLQCKENRPAPNGSGNVAASKEDQCAAL